VRPRQAEPGGQISRHRPPEDGHFALGLKAEAASDSPPLRCRRQGQTHALPLAAALRRLPHAAPAMHYQHHCSQLVAATLRRLPRAAPAMHYRRHCPQLVAATLRRLPHAAPAMHYQHHCERPVVAALLLAYCPRVPH
jgi:hypothetical protein